LNSNLLHPKIQKFIDIHLNEDLSKLLFKGTDFEGVSTLEIVEQIESKKKAKDKLPTWFSEKNIYYPNKLNIEQTSSEQTAAYKASILKGDSIIDLTGGLGVDAYYFSKSFKSVVHCEINPELSQIASHNFEQLKANSVETISENGLKALVSSKQHYDWIYVDPSRRHASKGKVFFLSDCEPNIPEHLDELFQHSHQIAIKTSPLLDLTAGIKELKFVKAIHVVALHNEVKELLWLLEKDHQSNTNMFTINISKNSTEIFEFQLNSEQTIEASFSEPLTYIYEPNAAILKSGAYKTLSKALGIKKLHPHSHLYTSMNLREFPGRSFKVEKVMAYSKKALKKEGIKKANLSTRNFPERVEQLRTRFKIKDGGDLYLFFTTNLHEQKIILICKKAEA